MAVVREMLRVVKPGGYAIAYEADFVVEMSDPPCPALASINKIWNGLFQNPTGGRQLVGYFRQAGRDADQGRRHHPARTRGHHAAAHLPADRRSDGTAGRLAGHPRRSRGARHGHRPDRVGGRSARGRRQVPRHVGDRAALSADRTPCGRIGRMLQMSPAEPEDLTLLLSRMRDGDLRTLARG